jgi:hypothetical protein
MLLVWSRLFLNISLNNLWEALICTVYLKHCNRYMEFNLGIKVTHLIDGTDLFRNGGLVLVGETIVANFHSS